MTGGSSVGCIISAGTWYTTGTCATFTAAASGIFFSILENIPGAQILILTFALLGTGFTLTSSKGACGIVGGSLSCGPSTAATAFSVRTLISLCPISFRVRHILAFSKASGTLLAASGNTNFYASSVPSGSTQATVYTSSSSAHSTALTISWQSI